MVVTLKRKLQLNNKLHHSLIASLLVVALSVGCEFNQPVVEVGETAVDLEQFRSRYRQFLYDTPLKDNLRTRYLFTDALIDEILFLEWADSSGLSGTDAALRDIQDMHDQLLLEKLYDHDIESHLNVTEADARLMYAWSKMRLHTRQLFAPDLKQAESLLSQLNEGVAWEALAARTFRDRQLAATGGDLGFNDLGDLESEFEQAAYRLKDGEISGPVRTKAGYRIIQVVEREIDPFLVEKEFTERREKFEKLALNQKRLPRLRTYTDSILVLLDLSFDDRRITQLADVWDQIGAGRNEWAIDIDTGPVLEIGNGSKFWSVGEAAHKLSILPARQRKAIEDEVTIRRALSGLAVQEYLLEKARSVGLADSESFKQRSAKLRRQYLIREVLSHIGQSATATESEIADHFDTHRAEMVRPQRFEIAEIVVSDEELANKLTIAIKGGADFGTLADENSERRMTAKVGGYVGWGDLRQFGGLSAALLGSEGGELLGPLPLAGKYVILQVHDREPSRQMTVKEATPVITEQLATLTRRRAYTEFRTQLRAGRQVAVDSLLLGTFNPEPGKMTGGV